MAPLIPRLQVFEIDDQTWFPSFLRAHIQNALTLTWTTPVPPHPSPASVAATILQRYLPALPSHTFIDFCAGGGGPTPKIERVVNRALAEAGEDEATFVMTDLHPNVPSWEALAARRPNLAYEAGSVDATDGGEVVRRWVERRREEARGGSGGGARGRARSRKSGRPGGGEEERVCRLFNLAFHHFDDDLARGILKDTVETSDAFAIFELQERSLASFLNIALLFPAALLAAPLYAFRRRSLGALLFTYLLPVIPFVLVFDGWMSALRTRTPEEVEALLHSCGAEEAEVARWKVRSGRKRFVWPFGYVNWIICYKD